MIVSASPGLGPRQLPRAIAVISLQGVARCRMHQRWIEDEETAGKGTYCPRFACVTLKWPCGEQSSARDQETSPGQEAMRRAICIDRSHSVSRTLRERRPCRKTAEGKKTGPRPLSFGTVTHGLGMERKVAGSPRGAGPSLHRARKASSHAHPVLATWLTNKLDVRLYIHA